MRGFLSCFTSRTVPQKDLLESARSEKKAAERFAERHPDETLSILAKYFRVADYYRDTTHGILALERCIEFARRLQERQQDPKEPRSPSGTSKTPTGKMGEKHACPGCRGTGRRPCDTCNGKKVAEGACKKCLGIKGTPLLCSRCTGSKEFTCTRCNGTGEAPVWVPGAGMRKGRCGGCNGHGKVRCNRCHGEGTEKCSECAGKGTGPCPTCAAAGTLRCPLCAGSGNHADPRASRDETGYYVAVNLDRTRTETRPDAEGNLKVSYATHALVYVLPSEVLKICRLGKGDSIWVVGGLGAQGSRSFAGEPILAIKNAEVYLLREVEQK